MKLKIHVAGQHVGLKQQMSWLEAVSLSLSELNWQLQTADHVLMSFTDQI